MSSESSKMDFGVYLPGVLWPLVCIWLTHCVM